MIGQHAELHLHLLLKLQADLFPMVSWWQDSTTRRISHEGRNLAAQIMLQLHDCLAGGLDHSLEKNDDPEPSRRLPPVPWP